MKYVLTGPDMFRQLVNLRKLEDPKWDYSYRVRVLFPRPVAVECNDPRDCEELLFASPDFDALSVSEIEAEMIPHVKWRDQDESDEDES